MGAWDNGNFGNDDAMDFVSDVQNKDSIVNAIVTISNTALNEYIESPDCCNALAAIEYIATALGNTAKDFPEEALEWVSDNKLLLLQDEKLIINAHLALEKIKTNSELKELWEETEEFEDWLNIVEGLKKRIS
jgi:hypothetical protein